MAANKRFAKVGRQNRRFPESADNVDRFYRGLLREFWRGDSHVGRYTCGWMDHFEPDATPGLSDWCGAVRDPLNCYFSQK